MKFIRNLLEKNKKLYHGEDAKFHKFWPLLDAFETFLFAPGNKTPKTGPHVRDYIDLKRTMVLVIYALLPCLAFSIYNTGLQHFLAVASLSADGAATEYAAGWLQSLLGFDKPDVNAPGLADILVFGIQQMGPIIFVSYFVGLNIEGVFAVIRKEEVSEGFLVSGLLIALIVPASIPLWQLAIAVAFSVVLAKEVFGGTGMNIFNPALMVRAFLFFAYAGQMSGSKVWIAGNAPQDLIDGYSGATPLAAAANVKLTEAHVDPAGTFANAKDAIVGADGKTVLDWWDLFWGWCPGSAGETSAFACLLGALLLLITGIASWRIMVAGVIGLFAMGWLFNLTALGHMDGIGSLPPHYHLVMGGFAFGIVFMATDPVSSPETNAGKWVYGLLIGGVTVIVRAVNPAYPEGTMLAILLLNAFAPTIDHFVVAANIKRRQARHG